MAADQMLSDEQLVAVAKSGDSSLLRALTEAERSRMLQLAQEPAPETAPNPELARLRGASAPDELSRIRPVRGVADTLPMIGGAVGGMVAGPKGAGVGGAAGEGYRQLATHAAEIPGALVDVGRNLIDQPAATIQGGLSGAARGAGGAAIQGGEQAALEYGGNLAMQGLKAGGEAVYRGYLKPSLARVNLPKATQIVRTAIDENLPMTSAGLARAGDLINQLKAKVDDLLTNASGRTVDLHAVAEDVRAWAKRMYDRPGRDPNDYQAVLKVADRIDGHPSVGAPNPTQVGPQLPTVDLPTANTVKRDLQASAADKFGLPNVSAEVAGEKYASAAARKAIEAEVPAVGPINMRESRLIDTARALARATGRDANRDKIIGTRAMVGGLLGGTLGGGQAQARGGSAQETAIGAAVGSLVGTLALSPAVATRAAILAAKLGERVPGAVPADLARAAVQAVLEQDGQ